jgi:hypothetical protein
VRAGGALEQKRGYSMTSCEIDEDYFKAQEERFAAHTAQESLFVDSKAVRA